MERCNEGFRVNNGRKTGAIAAGNINCWRMENDDENSGPPGHHYIAVASRMVIPKPINIEQVAIILMKAKKALQQLYFQWVVINRPASGIGFVMFWDGAELADDGYLWMNKGRTDTITTHQKSISIEATRFFDGYSPGDKYVTMTKTFYRFAGQQTSLYFVHYMSHPQDAPKKPIGPPIPTVKASLNQPAGAAQQKQEQDIAIHSTTKPSKTRTSPLSSPIQMPPNIASPVQPLKASNSHSANSHEPPNTKSQPQLSSPTTIRLSMNRVVQPPNSPAGQKTTRNASPGKKGRKTSSTAQQTTSNPSIQAPAHPHNDVVCDLDFWGHTEYSINRLMRIDSFLTKLFSVTTLGRSNTGSKGYLNEECQKGLGESLHLQLEKSREGLYGLEKKQNSLYEGMHCFTELENASTAEELLELAKRYNLEYLS